MVLVMAFSLAAWSDNGEKVESQKGVAENTSAEEASTVDETINFYLGQTTWMENSLDRLSTLELSYIF